MKPYLKASLLIGLASLGMATAAYAYQAAHGFDPASLDTDRNGAISTSELDTHADQLFTRADQDRNGQVSPDERRAFHASMQGAMHGPPPMSHEEHEAIFMSQAAFREALRRHATAVDTDRDGRLTVAEFSAAMQHGPAH